MAVSIAYHVICILLHYDTFCFYTLPYKFSNYCRPDQLDNSEQLKKIFSLEYANKVGLTYFTVTLLLYMVVSTAGN